MKLEQLGESVSVFKEKECHSKMNRCSFIQHKCLSEPEHIHRF